jgi:hypothetical protein
MQISEDILTGLERTNRTYNSEACSILKVLLKADTVWNFSRHALHQATATQNSETVPSLSLKETFVKS